MVTSIDGAITPDAQSKPRVCWKTLATRGDATLTAKSRSTPSV